MPTAKGEAKKLPRASAGETLECPGDRLFDSPVIERWQDMEMDVYHKTSSISETMETDKSSL